MALIFAHGVGAAGATGAAGAADEKQGIENREAGSVPVVILSEAKDLQTPLRSFLRCAQDSLRSLRMTVWCSHTIHRPPSPGGVAR